MEITISIVEEGTGKVRLKYAGHGLATANEAVYVHLIIAAIEDSTTKYTNSRPGGKSVGGVNITSSEIGRD